MIFNKVWSGIKNLFSTEVEIGEPFSFPKIKSLNDVIRDLKIDEYARKDGEKNLPRTDRKPIGATEEKIIGFYNRLIQNSKVFGTEYSNNVKQNIDNSGIMSVDANCLINLIEPVSQTYSALVANRKSPTKTAI